MNKEEFERAIIDLGLTITPKIAEQLEQYASFLLAYNAHTNLTAIRTKEEVYLKHFYDSITLVKIADLSHGKLLDVGTGAGFPGLVLAIFFPNLQVTLLDSNNKKITFLKECVQKLSLTNVEIIYSRAEDYTRVHREEYDFVTSRAVAELRILLELNIPSLKIHGHFLVMKGNAEEEIRLSTPTLAVLSCEKKKKQVFELPKENGIRTLLDIEKNKATDLKYPRNYDKIKKHPLK